MKDELLYCPLGGAGEIGMNMNLFGYGQEDDHKWIMVDVGVTFADDTIPGVDLIYPDPGYAEDKKDNFLGIILTHAHEDHIGAITHVWPKFKCKIYATPFTAALVTEKFREKKIDITSYLQIVQLGSTINLKPFKIEFITMTHSIVEPNGLRIETPAGSILHTGDWKCDPNPLVGDNMNSKRLIEIGKEGVLTMICDSTNVLSVGRSGSEKDVRDSMLKIIEKQKKRVIVGTTGFTLKEENIIKKISRKIPILKAGNMSLGINLLMYLTEIASKSLGNNFLSKIFEAHHKFKKDHPSGTALMLGQGIAIGKNRNFYGIIGKKYLNKKKFPYGKRINFNSVRRGKIIGEHEVLFSSGKEIIRLNHKAFDRALYSEGALTAASWLMKKKPGLYSMRDLMNFK